MSIHFATTRADFHRRLCDKVLHFSGQDQSSLDESVPKKTVIQNAARQSLSHALLTKMGATSGGEIPNHDVLQARFVDVVRGFLNSTILSNSDAAQSDLQFSIDPAIESIVPMRHQLILRASSQLQRIDRSDLKQICLLSDIIIGRHAVSDEDLNINENLVGQDEKAARLTQLRLRDAINRKGKSRKKDSDARQILHASISCKWTLRSDRAQNARTEALNLIRNRKGRTPHVVIVTMEPLPSRIASIALGTGDIDCTYHAALYELLEVARESIYADSAEALDSLVATRRLRDISDLPMDLAT